MKKTVLKGHNNLGQLSIRLPNPVCCSDVYYCNTAVCVAVGHTVLAINGIAAQGRQLEDGRDIQELIETEENYPIAIKFGRPKLTTNEKIMLAGMFHSWVFHHKYSVYIYSIAQFDCIIVYNCSISVFLHVSGVRSINIFCAPIVLLYDVLL